MKTERVYLDHNATTPLRAEARDAMVGAMNLVGNPSSVHAEGRAAKMLVERARAQVADLVGCAARDVVFTSGATEGAATVLQGQDVVCSGVEHDCVVTYCRDVLDCTEGAVEDSLDAWGAQQGANSETGIMQNVRAGRFLSDLVQQAGKLPVAFESMQCRFGLISAHKLGGPKGVGAILLQRGVDIPEPIRGGGQEMGRRSGTENVIGIAGFGAAAEAAKRDVDTGEWARIEKLRNILEKALEAASNETIFVGKDVARLPNTSCILTPGWKGETQVMQMDLAGFAVSAGSACSSGKVKASRVLQALGYDDRHAASAIRVSMGLETTEDEVMRFADAWIAALAKHKGRSA